MKYGLGIKLLISFIVGGIAVLYKIRLNPRTNQSEISSVVKVPRPFLFNIVTTPENVPDYFSWVTTLYQSDPSKTLIIGKEYQGRVNMPFLGQHEVRYVISEFKEGSWLILKPRAHFGSYFNTEIVLMLNSITKTETQFYMKIIYHRPSALFQLTLGPFLKWLTDQELDRISARVRALAMSKWALWRDSSYGSKKKKGNGTTAEAAKDSKPRPVMKHSDQLPESSPVGQKEKDDRMRIKVEL